MVTLEDHVLSGGFGCNVLAFARCHDLNANLLTHLSLPDRFIGQDSRTGQLCSVSLDSAGIARHIRNILNGPCDSDDISTVSSAVSSRLPKSL